MHRRLPTSRIVITGGPCSGKTTLGQYLAARGYPLVTEAALEVITRLTRELGPARQLQWRREHVAEFQDRILKRQIELESRVPSDAPVVFHDRSRWDGLAYFRFAGVQPSREVVRQIAQGCYTAVFLLETPDQFDPRIHTGRAPETRGDSLQLRQLLLDVYREAGLPPTTVPVMPTAARAELVLRALHLLPA